MEKVKEFKLFVWNKYFEGEEFNEYEYKDFLGDVLTVSRLHGYIEEFLERNN